MDEDSEQPSALPADTTIELTPLAAATTPRRSRRVVAAISIGAAFALAIAALAVTRPWQRGSGSATSKTAEQSTDAADAPRPLKLLVAELPDGHQLQWMQDPERTPPEEIGNPNQNQVVVLAKPDAKFGSGGWIAVTTQLMDRFERARFDPTSDGQM